MSKNAPTRLEVPNLEKIALELPTENGSDSIKIFLDDNGFHALKRAVPGGSRGRAVLGRAEQVNFFDVVLTCTKVEARTLMLYADQCPGVLAAIQKALCAGEPRDSVTD